MGKRPPKWMPGERVDETILLQRKSVEQLRVDKTLRKDTLNEQKMKHKARMDMKRKKKLATKKFVPAQAVLKQAVKKETSARRYWQAGEKFAHRAAVRGPERLTQVYNDAAVALVVRAKGNMIPQDVRGGFARLGLTKLYKARLVHLNARTHKLIQQLTRFSLIGFPSTTQLERLVRTRGSFWNSETKSKAYISGNLQVEQKLGHLNILSIEELVDCIVGKTACVDEVLRHLAPFDLHPPRALHMERKRTVHEKLEIVNPESFATYLDQELGHDPTGAAKQRTRKLTVLAKRQVARKAPAASPAASKKVATKKPSGAAG